MVLVCRIIRSSRNTEVKLHLSPLLYTTSLEPVGISVDLSLGKASFGEEPSTYFRGCSQRMLTLLPPSRSAGLLRVQFSIFSAGCSEKATRGESFRRVVAASASGTGDQGLLETLGENWEEIEASSPRQLGWGVGDGRGMNKELVCLEEGGLGVWMSHTHTSCTCPGKVHSSRTAGHFLEKAAIVSGRNSLGVVAL